MIAATNRSLKDEVKERNFREDLYYRLNVVALTMPSLRDREDDIVVLARHFLSRFARKAKRRVTGLSDKAAELLKRHRWPGNVRELENAIERAVVLGSTELILPDDLPEALFEAPVSTAAPDGGDGPEPYHDGVTRKKRKLILDAMQRARGSFTEAAKLLELHPNYLHRLVRNLELREEIEKLK